MSTSGSHAKVKASPTGTPAAGPLAGSRRALFVAASGTALANRHAALVANLAQRRHRVVCLAPRLDGDARAALTAAGAEVRAWPASDSFLRALAERNETSALKAIVADWQPHVALIEADTPTLPALVAARAAGVPRVLALVDGADAFASGARPDVKRWRRAFEGIHGAVFSNSDDVRTLTTAGVLGTGLAPQVVPGGVDLAANAQQPLPGLGEGLVFAMIAALDARHGVTEFLEAAGIVAAQAPNARFLLAGPLPADPSAETTRITQAISARAGAVQYLGATADARTVLARCHVFVYPARAGGMPLPLYTALAAGRPVITTATPACRETIDERVSGCLVPPGDAAALADAMTSFLRRPDLIPSMARAARIKAERRFDAHAATDQLDELLGLG